MRAIDSIAAVTACTCNNNTAVSFACRLNHKITLPNAQEVRDKTKHAPASDLLMSGTRPRTASCKAPDIYTPDTDSIIRVHFVLGTFCPEGLA
eukprot:359987-Pleurochrysis_carterae.AAC.1